MKEIFLIIVRGGFWIALGALSMQFLIRISGCK